MASKPKQKKGAQTLFVPSIPFKTGVPPSLSTRGLSEIYVMEFDFTRCGCPIDFNSATIEIPEIHGLKFLLVPSWFYPTSDLSSLDGFLTEQQYICIWRSDPKPILSLDALVAYSPDAALENCTYSQQSISTFQNLSEQLAACPNLNEIIAWQHYAWSYNVQSLGDTETAPQLSETRHILSYPRTDSNRIEEWEYNLSLDNNKEGWPLFANKFWITVTNFMVKGRATGPLQGGIPNIQSMQCQLKWSKRTINMNEFMLRNFQQSYTTPSV